MIFMTLPYLFGVLMTAIGLYMLIEQQVFKHRSRYVVGHIYGYESITYGGRDMMFPVIEYVDKTTLFRFRSTIGSYGKDQAIGTPVDVLIVDSNGGKVRMLQSNRTMLSLVLAGVGLFFMLMFSFILAVYPELKWSMFAIPLVIMLMYRFVDNRVAVNKVGETMPESSKHESSVPPMKENRIDRSEVVIQSAFTPDAQRYLIIIGTIFLLFGLYWSKQSISLSHNTMTAEGIISKVIHKKNNKTLYVKYTAPSGEHVQFIDKRRSNTWNLHVGDRVKILYDAHDLKNAQIDNGTGISFVGPVLMNIVSLGILLAGILLYRKRGRW